MTILLKFIYLIKINSKWITTVSNFSLNLYPSEIKTTLSFFQHILELFF